MRRITAAIAAAALSASLFCADAAAYEPFTGCGGDTVALTFDDGPHPSQTDRILAILDKYGVKATFFEIGRNVRLYPDVTARVAAAGHEIANHTDSHVYLRGKGADFVKGEITAADAAIIDACGIRTRFVRPPGGIYDKTAVDTAGSLGKTAVLWSIDTNDWAHRSCARITDEILNGVRGGDIILMHDYVTGECHTCEALEIVIPELLSRGYKFVTLSEMYDNYLGRNSSRRIEQTPMVLYSPSMSIDSRNVPS